MAWALHDNRADLFPTFILEKSARRGGTHIVWRPQASRRRWSWRTTYRAWPPL